jgi:Cupin-like domain
MVEARPPGGAFGRGVKRRWKFGTFLDALESGDEQLYLSAQDAATDVDGHPALLTEPLSSVQRSASGSAAGIPLRPQIMGKLVPHSINIWLGRARSPNGTSSGLHHDYHDNLYVLLSGRKRFKLFPPELARRMHTNGKIWQRHINGRYAVRCSASAMHVVAGA